MSVGPEALRRFGPLLFLACPRGRAAVRAPRVFRAAACAPRVFLAAVRARGRRPARSPSAPRAFGSARRLKARPGPAAAHGHRSQAHQFLRHPPHQWCLSFLCVSHPGPAAAHQHHSRPTNSCRALHTSRAVVADVDRRVVSKPIQAPPPTGTAARPTNSSGTLHTSRAVVADVARRVVSKPIQAPPPLTSAAARPTNSSGTLHTSRAVVADVARRVVSKPGQAPPPPTSTTAGPSDCSVLSTPVAVGFYRIRSRLPTCRGSNDATFPFGGGEATT